jgi:type IV pilus assembly protein PilM
VGPDQLNFLRAGQVRQGTETNDEIIMLAAPAETIENHLDLLDKVSLIPEAIDAEPVALFRTFERFLRRRSDEESVSVIVDVGFSGTRVVVAQGRNVVFIKNIDIGGRKLTDAVAGQLNLTYAEAAELRIRNMCEDRRPQTEHGDAEKAETEPCDRSSLEWTIHDAVRGQVESLSREISLCLRYCAVTFRGPRPKEVILAGGEAYDKTLVSLFDENLGAACRVGQPLRGIDTSGVSLGSDRRGSGSEWAMCIGLAIRGADMGRSLQEDDHE